MSIGKRIKQRREELRMSQDELAKRIGYKSRSSINKIELDLYNLKQTKIKDIADALQTTPAYIMGWDESDVPTTEPAAAPTQKGVDIDVFDADVNQVVDTEEISTELAVTGNFFGLRIQGDSMSPRIMEGDTVIVRQQNDAESGDIVIVKTKKNSATCKRLMKYAEGLSLISFNPAYEPLSFSNQEIEEEEVEIVGKVVENRQKYI
jgi:repressor LexA